MSKRGISETLVEASTATTADNPPPIKYCLYARKSSEDDERQALSIDSQTKEMMELAEHESLEVIEVKRESHSAKAVGGREVYNELLSDVRSGKFGGILTWAPDRLSRNAGDLGALVDLMDQGRLVEIRTHAQRFTNSANEKFLLMILCSQAKLENDNRSANVKRGFRAKVAMGYRPNMAPLGYLHDISAPKGEKRIFLDPERAPIIRKMFEKVANEGWSGRDIQQWLNGEGGFKTRSGKDVTLSSVFLMLKNDFYTGRFEFPVGSGKWYEGKHPQIIDQELFDRVKEQLKTAPKSLPGTKEFAFARVFRCGGCGSSITPDEKIKRRKDGSTRRYVYYRCTQAIKHICNESYVREEEIVSQLSSMVDALKIKEMETMETIRKDLARLRELLTVVGGETQTIELREKLDLKAYAKFILSNGTKDEQRELISHIDSGLVLRDRKIVKNK